MTTLQNFGVPLGGGAGRGGMLMPKVKNRFRVIVTNFGVPSGSIALTQQVVTVSRPNVTFAPQTVHSYNSTAYYAGKAEWETVSLNVRDDITNAVSSLVGAQLQKQMNFFDQTVPAAAGDYKFGMLVHSLDGGNDVVLEEWVFEGCFLSQTNYQSYDYGSSDAMTIEMTIRFDNVTMSNGLFPLVPTLLSTSFIG
jgi:hypothetical protein